MQDQAGNTLLHCAAQHPAVTSTLLGDTILNYGLCSPHTINQQHQTASDVARAHGNHEVSTLLKQRMANLLYTFPVTLSPTQHKLLSHRSVYASCQPEETCIIVHAIQDAITRNQMLPPTDGRRHRLSFDAIVPHAIHPKQNPLSREGSSNGHIALLSTLGQQRFCSIIHVITHPPLSPTAIKLFLNLMAVPLSPGDIILIGRVRVRELFG